jgi:two-component system response regulator HydG
MTDRILVIDDDADQCALLHSSLSRLGYDVETCTSSREGLERARAMRDGVIITDIEMAELSGLELCAELRGSVPAVPIIVITGQGSIDVVVTAIRAGAYDYIPKPLDAKQVALRVARAMQHGRLIAEVDRLRDARLDTLETATIRGKSSAMRALDAMIARVAPTDASVLIQGDTGTGKELVARALHKRSARASGPFVAINCAAVPPSLLESELFGHERGAFTDAKLQRDGLFVQATGGTLFLDEIGEMPLEMQSKLLRALQERKVRPVGSNREVAFDARILAATHRDLDEEVKERRFREDLYYRINVVRIDVPALCDRRDDILELASYFLDRFAARAGKPKIQLSTRVAELLMAYEWPGNVRELENCMERVAALGRYEQALPEDLPEAVRKPRFSASEDAGSDQVVSLDELERQHILKVLKKANGNKTRAAELLGLDRRTLYRKLEIYAQESGTRPAGDAALESSPPPAPAVL